MAEIQNLPMWAILVVLVVREVLPFINKKDESKDEATPFAHYLNGKGCTYNSDLANEKWNNLSASIDRLAEASEKQFDSVTSLTREVVALRGMRRNS